jgi:hypothetical protein
VEILPGCSRGLASIAVVGNAGNAAGIGINHGELVQWRRVRGEWSKLAEVTLPHRDHIFLAIEIEGAEHLNTLWSLDGEHWKPLGAGIEVTSLPPWDTGLRIGLTCGAAADAKAAFRSFHLSVREQ